jgi:hypothetical protein
MVDGSLNCFLIVPFMIFLLFLSLIDRFYFLRLFVRCLIASVLAACLRPFIEGILRFLVACLMFVATVCL